MIFMNSSEMPIPEKELYVIFSNTFPLFVTQSLVFVQHGCSGYNKLLN